MTDEPGDVASTLNELERKLRELESDLQAVVEPDSEPPLDVPEPLPPLRSEPAEPSFNGPVIGGDQPVDVRRLVSEAQERIVALRDELDQLARVREEIVATANQLVSDYDRALQDAAAPPPPPAPMPPPPMQAPPFQLPAHPPGGFQPQPVLGAPLEQTLLYGNVSIDAGLFVDLTTLSAFEQALRRVSGVLRVSTRGFAEGRALLDIQLAHPVALAYELRQLVPMPFTVTEASPTHLMIAIGA